MGRAIVSLCGAVVLATAACSSVEPDADGGVGVAQAETADGEVQAAVRLAFADDRGGLSGTFDPSEVPDLLESELQSDEPSTAIVTLRHERAPENVWMQLAVDGRTPSDSSRAIRPMSEVQQFVVRLDGGGRVPVTVTPSGAFAQAVADGTPPIGWNVDVTVAEPPERSELLGCWVLTAGENTTDGISTWWPADGIGTIELSEDGASHVNDDMEWNRSGRFDYSDGTLSIQDALGDLSYTVARLDTGTPPLGGEATLLLQGEERNLQGLRFGDRCDELDESDLDPEQRWDLSPEAVRAMPVVDPARQVDLTHASPACRDASYPIDPDRSHIEESYAPSASELYGELPPTSGPHFVGVLPPQVALQEEVDPRSAVHNLEHGAIVLWIDPSHADADLVSAWARTLGVAGFSARVGGGGILAAPLMDDATVTEPIVLTAWGQRLVCDEFDVKVADRFVAEFYGDRGSAPERSFTPYPPNALHVPS
jgi:hypothetical protein